VAVLQFTANKYLPTMGDVEGVDEFDDDDI
jgi:hypothetical protein